jgi:hypothetical protein
MSNSDWVAHTCSLNVYVKTNQKTRVAMNVKKERNRKQLVRNTKL